MSFQHDDLVKSRLMAMEKGPEARHSVWPGVKSYINVRRTSGQTL